MNSDESRRLSISQTLSQVAVGLIFALAAFLAFALDKRELGPIYWALVILGVFFLVASMILGGRGVSRISSPGGLFNMQAWTCLVGFLFLAGSLLALGKTISNDMNTLVIKIAEKVGAVKARLDILEPSVLANTGHIQSNDLLIIQLTAEIKQLNNHLSQMEVLHEGDSQPASQNSGKAQQEAPMNARTSRH